MRPSGEPATCKPPILLELIRPQLRQSVGALEALLARFGEAEATDRRKHALLLLAVSHGTRVLRRYDPESVTAEEAADLLAFAAEAVLAAGQTR